MSGKFLNVEMMNVINSLADGVKEKIANNAFYTFNDKKPTMVTFYNPDPKLSTLDDGTKQIYESVGPQSGLRFNKIENTILYNIEKILLNIDIGEWGTESDPVEGEAYLPPETFVPYTEGYFVINHVGKNIFFRILAVGLDTIENGANFYKLTYKLDNFDLKIDKQVVGDFKMIIGNIGTSFKTVISNNEYDFISSIEDVTDTLIEYYNSLFFKNRVQTYIFPFNDCFFYDPYMVEFAMRNNILSTPDRYIFVTQQVFLPYTFCIEYNKTIFKHLETMDNKIDFQRVYGVMVTDPCSLLTTRMEDYFMIEYNTKLGMLADPIDLFDTDFIEVVLEGKILEPGHSKEYYNIIGCYFHNRPVTQDMINALEKIEYSPSIELYYNIPIVVFILEHFAKDILKTDLKTLA